MSRSLRWRCLLAVVALSAAVGGGASAAPGDRYSVTVHFAAGSHTEALRLKEPAGVILLYRLRASRGIAVRAFTQLPRLTVPLAIATAPTGPSSACVSRRRGVVCTVGEEWCPMPAAVWHVRLLKRGAAGVVTVTFHVGTPPR